MLLEDVGVVQMVEVDELKTDQLQIGRALLAHLHDKAVRRFAQLSSVAAWVEVSILFHAGVVGQASLSEQFAGRE